MESGAITFGGACPITRQEVEAACQELMDYVGASGIEDLRKMDAWDLFDAYEKVVPTGALGNIRFCIDGEFLPENYYERITAGKINDFDVMIGSCAL